MSTVSVTETFRLQRILALRKMSVKNRVFGILSLRKAVFNRNKLKSRLSLSVQFF